MSAIEPLLLDQTAAARPVQYRLVEDPAAFSDLVTQLARQPELWIDTEVADWNTAAPRLSLLQVRDGGGRVHLIDALRPGMAAVINCEFIPRVMADPAITKWAHNAGFERRFLGSTAVRSLECTLRLARSVPYYVLPVRSLGLASIVLALFGERLDKRHQKADWGRRPLSLQQLQYAAADPDWCYRVQRELSARWPPVDPARESPEELERTYRELLPALADARGRHEAIRAAVKALLVRTGRDRFSGFVLRTRVVGTLPLPHLIRLARVVTFDGGLSIPISKKVRSTLPPEMEARVRDCAAVHRSATLHGPRMAEGAHPRPATYEIGLADEDRVGRDYERADHELRLLTSRANDTRSRLRAWMEYEGVRRWDSFSLSVGAEQWKVPLSALEPLLPCLGERMLSVPRKLGQVLDPDQMRETTAAGTFAETRFLLWRPRHEEDVPPQETRDWDESSESEADEVE
jgi:ribonuclease D